MNFRPGNGKASDCESDSKRALSPLVQLVGPAVIAVVFSTVGVWMAQSSKLEAATQAVAETRSQVTDLQRANETRAVELARVTAQLEAAAKRLDEVVNRLERIEGLRNSARR